MVVEDEVDRHAMVAANKIRIRGIIDMPTIVPDPPEAGGDEVSNHMRSHEEWFSYLDKP